MTDAPSSSASSSGEVSIEEARVMNLVAQRLFDAAAPPLRVGRFDVLERIGEGGMEVFVGSTDGRRREPVASCSGSPWKT